MASRLYRSLVCNAARRNISGSRPALKESGPGNTGNYDGLSQLGGTTKTPDSPLSAVLERVPNAHKETPYLARFSCPEFTSLCPVTGQPDFAHLVIDYIPRDWLVESKSLKLYLTSFRNHGDFHEACTVGIGTRLVKELDPVWLRIGGYWYPRGGIPIDVFYSTGAPPTDVWIPEQGCPPYRGRG
jgi:7-cyano-7-deazaguanine reductase